MRRLGLDIVIDRVYAKDTMKYDSMRKLERNAMLREYAKAHPELSLKEIGQHPLFNISESRVWRILHGKKGKKCRS